MLLFSPFQKTKTMQTSGSVFAKRIDKVEKTKFELELIKFVDCFLDGHGIYDSNLVSFRIKTLKQTKFFLLRLARVSILVKMLNIIEIRISNFKSCQILKQNIYNVSDFELGFLQRVRFWIKNFTRRQILKKNLFLNSKILKKKIFLKSTSLKKKIFLKSTSLKKKVFLKSTTLKKNLFFRSRFWKKICSQKTSYGSI